MSSNTPLKFGSDLIQAEHLTECDHYEIQDPTILFNADCAPLFIRPGEPPLRPWRSTLLRRDVHMTIASGVTVRLPDPLNLGGITQYWTLFGSTLPPDSAFPINTPLWVSTEVTLPCIQLKHHVFSGEVPSSTESASYVPRLRMWYAAPETDCYIHRMHDFLEIHTQIHGTGHMQKFEEQEANTMYEDVAMTVGMTHECFAVVRNSEFSYPWHRYLSRTDCIWMAVELHPCPLRTESDSEA